MIDLDIEDVPNFYQRILDSLPLSVAVLDDHGEIIETNSEWIDFGQENEIDPSYLGREVNYIDVCRDSDDEYGSRAEEGLRSIIRGRSDEFSMEYPCHSPDEKRWFLMYARPLKDGFSHYVLVVHLDITERVTTEQELRHKEKLASIGEMAANIMHEINNPNTVIDGNLNYLKKRMNQLPEPGDEGLPEEYRDFFGELDSILDEMLSGSQKITRIVNRIEEFAMKQTTEKKTTSLTVLAEVLDRTLREVVSSSDEGDFIRIDVDKFPSDQTSNRGVALSEDELESILSNLVENALSTVRESEPDDPEIVVDLRVDSNQLEIWVMDNGEGIEDEKLMKVKDPFFTTKSISEGTGLGLSIVSNLTKKADGELNIYSEPGEGTWICVELPLLQPN